VEDTEEDRHKVALGDREVAAVRVLDTVKVPVPFQSPAVEGVGDRDTVPHTVGVTVRVPVVVAVGEMVEVVHSVALTEEEEQAVKQALLVKDTVSEGLPDGDTVPVVVTVELRHREGVVDMVKDPLLVRHSEEVGVGVLDTDMVKDCVEHPLLVRDTLTLTLGEGEVEG